MIKYLQLLVNTQVDINRAVFEGNKPHDTNEEQPRPEYIMECVDSALAALKEYKKRSPLKESKTREKLPPFVWMGEKGKCALRLVGKQYWRDGGEWGVSFKRDNEGNLIVVSTIRDMRGKLLIACTEKEWRDSNDRYVPQLKKKEE